MPRTSALATCLLLAGAMAPADDLAQLFPNLLSRSIVTPSSVPVHHEGHFFPALSQQSAAFDLNKALVTYLSTFPVGSSSGGFTYQSDPATGVPQRSSNNFGPSFSERALTIGKGKFSGGVNFESIGYDRFEGLDLGSESEAGEIVFYLQHNNCCPGQLPDGTPGPPPLATDPNAPLPGKDPAFEGDLLRMDLGLEVRNLTTVIFGNYGLTDRLDVGVAVPIVSVELKAGIDATIERISGSPPNVHSFEPNQDVATARFEDSGSATGIGDIVLRAKYNFLYRPGGGLAASLDLRLPTGDEDDLLGTGATQTKLMLIYSGDYGRFAPRLNLGYTFSSGNLSDSAVLQPADDQGAAAVVDPVDFDLEVPDEINYAAGFSLAASPRATLNFDVLGRSIRYGNRFGIGSQAFPFRTRNFNVGGVVQETLTTTTRELVQVVDEGNINIVLGVAGVKFNVAKTLLLTGSVLFPLSDDGLRASVSGVIGFDYAF
jgi:hypothetical protein